MAYGTSRMHGENCRCLLSYGGEELQYSPNLRRWLARPSLHIMLVDRHQIRFLCLCLTVLGTQKLA